MAITLPSTTGSTTGTLSSAGVGSGLDVAGIVSKLMAVENQKLTAIDNRKSSYQSKISAYGAVKSALAQFQSSLAGLKDAAALAAVSAASSDTATLGVDAGAKAIAGNYAVQVTQLAKAAKLVSAGFATTSDVVGMGTLTFDFGTTTGTSFSSSGNGVKSVTIGPDQQTLAGVRDAVNAAGIGVTATIVNDGSASGNRLVFTSNTSGAASSMKVVVTDSDTTNGDAAGLSRLAYDPAGAAGNGRNLTQNVAAQDAKLTVDGIAISKPNNVITDAIDGVTLNLVKETTGDGVKVTVSADASAAGKAVSGFVTAYNALVSTLSGLTKYDPAAKQGSVLTGDSLVRGIRSQLSSILGGSVAGLSSNGATANTLWQAGVSLKADGTLALDSAKLNTLAATPGGIARIFAAVGRASDSAVGVAATTAATTPGSYSLAVTQLATQGTLQGSAGADLTIVAGVNDQLDVTIDGVAASVTLTAGVYATADALASDVQSRINGVAAVTDAGSRVVVTNSGGVLTLTSARFGSASNIALGGSAVASLLGASPVATGGVDVAGTIDGIAAAGSGQTLRAAAGSPAEGLALAVTGGVVGNRGTVTYSRGYAATLDSMLTDFLNANGAVASRTDGMNRSIHDLDKQRTAMSARLAMVQARYQAEFGGLDTLLGQMQTTSNYLTQQLANLPKINTTS